MKMKMKMEKEIINLNSSGRLYNYSIDFIIKINNNNRSEYVDERLNFVNFSRNWKCTF